MGSCWFDHELACLINRKGDIRSCKGHILRGTNCVAIQGFIYNRIVEWGYEGENYGGIIVSDNHQYRLRESKYQGQYNV